MSDSDGDVHSGSDVESLDEDFYGSEADDCEADYTVMTEEDVRRRQEDEITRLSAVLSISRDATTVLLLNCNWSVSKAHDAWFDEGGVPKGAGLLVEGPVVEYPNKDIKLTCGICFEDCPRGAIHSAACGHPFCGTCWTSYIRTSVNDGPGCLSLRCPEPSCRAAVGKSMIDLLAPDDEKRKYSLYLLQSYIEGNRKTKWCPAPGCEHAVEFAAGSEGNYDVSCTCSHNFCWNCTEEAHRPVDCGTVSKWIMKNKDEAENTLWVLAHAKPCPKCKRPIEKNQGCMHMTCRPPCNFEFCWICLEPWSAHVDYTCNRYKRDEDDEGERMRKMAKESLERYSHYYERWASNESSRKKAVADLVQVETVHLEKVRGRYSQTESEIMFITEAWQQIVECRRVLKWTYAYGYYLPEHERAKKAFFEDSQGVAESCLERLHWYAEKELHQFLDDEEAAPSSSFDDFRSRLAGLTRVTKHYFENLVRALQNGLSEVGSNTGGGGTGSNTGRGGTSSNTRGGGTSSTSQTDDSSHWSCDRCTYANVISSVRCTMCWADDAN